jgi:hypothetical protein
MLYDITYEVVTEIMELIDGYSGYSDSKRIENVKYSEYKSKICAKGVSRSARHKLDIIL